MYEAALKLGVAVVKAACGIWIGNPMAENAATTVVDLVQEKVTGKRDQRRLERKFAEIEESIAERVLGYLDHEFRGLPENEREAAVLAVADTFERAGLTDRVLFEQDLDPLYLEGYVRDKVPRATRDLNDAAVALYDRVLPESCAYVMATLRTLPRFQAGAFTELLRRESLILGKLDELLDRIPKDVGRQEDTGAAFETAYRRKAAERWDVLELFGTEAHTRSYPLTLAYLSLRVAWAQQERDRLISEIQSLPSGDLRVEQALAQHRRTFLRGPAGTGKTTLLRWVGVRASRGDFPEAMSSWNGLIPFMVPLRQYVGEQLPEPADFVRHTGRHLADQAPEGWVTGVLEAGRGIVLVDGVDELPQGQREVARRWLRDLMADFPDCRYVVTTRPGAAKESWLETDGFISAELQPLTDKDVRSFIHHWHEAVRSEIVDETERALLTTYEHDLARKVMGQRHLSVIASTPLLCALLCALHRDRQTALPRDRMEVYEAALAMLLKDRDQERGIEGVELSRKELVLLLQELAKWLVINGSSDAPTNTAQRQVTRVLASMHRVEDNPEEVFTHLIVRSGLLQCPTADRVSFLHRTFEEYLAAKAIVEEDSFPLLVSKAHDDQWHEVVMMAAGHATPAQREEMVTRLLDKADEVKKHHDRLLLVAFACLETSPHLPQHLREEVEKRVRSILPPRTKEHVHTLSMVGESVLPLLAKTPPKNARQAAKTIEAAALIGGSRSTPVIKQALPFRSRDVFFAAQDAWERGASPELAEVLLEDAINSYHYTFPIRTVHLELLSRYAPRARTAVIQGEGSDTIEALAGMPDLGKVILHADTPKPWREIDLSPLRDSTALRTFMNGGRTSVARIEPLLGSPLTNFVLTSPTQVCDLHLIASFRELKRLQFDWELPVQPFSDILQAENQPLELTLRYQRAIHDLDFLRVAPHSLDHIRIITCPQLKDLTGLLSQAESLAGFSYQGGANHIMDISVLKELPNLDSIDMNLRHANTEEFTRVITSLPSLRSVRLSYNVAHVEAPAWLRELPELHTLRMHGRGPVDLTPLAGVTNLTVELPRFRSLKATGSELLGEGSRVVRYNPFLPRRT
ncbi:NACHT domain-containing protein [Nocardiopsis metallicus]|uniref:NACHT domain-containing protein n=1 Tax=Nocardiopsis metallicus TaxID=179819 RepID=A0A840W006_9ACTN|nr:NACHT domain-containing protein [Nocardiopsis metallicus]MBB5490110.1 hypothetical protein [Nocardiopsis metallicus]